MMRFVSCATLVVLLLSAGQAAAYYPLWARDAALMSTGDYRGIAAADFNGDGHPDIVARTLNQVVVARVSAGGTFQSLSVIYTGSALTDVASADVNRDGKADVIVAESNPDSIVVLLSNGDGTFDSPVISPVSVEVSDVSIADLTGDETIDVAVRSAEQQALALYAGDGAGSFSLLASRSLSSAPTVVEAGDIDRDGNEDYILGYADAPYEISFGRGDGTFDSPVPLGFVTAGAARIVLGDLDADGDREILIPHFAADTLTVVVNDGNRTFASPAVYDTFTVPAESGNPSDLVVAEVNGDDHVDVVIAFADGGFLATLTGNGDGSLNVGAYLPTNDWGKALYLAAADFTADGRIDVAIGTYALLGIWKNISGDVHLNFFARYRTVSEGQSGKFTVYITPERNFFAGFDPNSPVPTGTVSLKRDGVEIGTATLSNASATIETTPLPLGTHAITAHYSGDPSYRAKASNPVEHNVVEEETTTTITSSGAGREVPFNEPFVIRLTVTSPIDSPLDGEFFVYVDGAMKHQRIGPTSEVTYAGLTPGTHTFYATFEGTTTQPPSRSETISQVIVKAESKVTFESEYRVVGHSEQSTVRVVLEGVPLNRTPGGAIHLYDGGTLVGTTSVNSICCSSIVYVDIPVSLSIGEHYLSAQYAGDEYFEPSTSRLMKYVVFSGQPFLIDMWTSGNFMNARGFYVVPSGGYFRIFSRRGSAPGWMQQQSTAPAWSQYQPDPGVPYVVRMEAYDSSNRLLASSNTDMAMFYAFTEYPLAVGTVIKSVHLTEIVAAANALRSATGLGSISFNAGAGELIRATHVLQLRTAINEARVALGADAVAFTGNVGIGLPVRASHIQELRDAIR